MAAIRCLKAMMRQYVYQQQEGPDWDSLLYIAESFVKGAQVEWYDVLALWKDKPEEVRAIVDRAAIVAEVETIDSLVERIPTTASILKNFNSYNILAPKDEA